MTSIWVISKGRLVEEVGCEVTDFCWGMIFSGFLEMFFVGTNHHTSI